MTQSSQEIVQIGIIGAGQIGKYHLEMYQKVPAAKIMAIADLNEAEARRVAEQYHIPHVFTDFRDLLDCKEIEAVDVCLHNNLHAPVSIAAMEAGKHVYCEKPMAGSFRDAELMFQTMLSTGQMLNIQLFTPFLKETKAAKALIDSGRLGKIYHARSVGCRRRGRPYVDGYGSPAFVQKEISAGGALYDMGIYHIANLLYLLGNPSPMTISGKCYQEIAMDAERRAQSHYNVEEMGLGFVRLENDATLDIIESWAMHLETGEGSSIIGTLGGIRLSPFSFYQNAGELDLDCTTNLEEFDQRMKLMNPNYDTYEGPQHHWVAALQKRIPLLPSAAWALNTMLISEGIYLSSQLGREVTAEEVKQHSRSTAQLV
jgi:predicted dehydrogenase